MKRALLIIFIILFVVFCVVSLAYMGYRYVFTPNSNVVSVFNEDEVTLIIEGEQVISKHIPKVIDNEILLPIDTIKEHFDPYIYWDDELKKVTVTTENRVIRMKTDTLEALVNDEPMELNISAFEEDGTVYVPVKFLSDFYSIEISYLQENNVIIIDYKNRMKQIANAISPEAVVRKGQSIRYPIVKELDVEENSSLRVFEEYEKWFKVRTEEGIIGYIEKRFVVVKWVTANNVQPEEYSKNKKMWEPDRGKINLVWEMMYSGRPDLSRIGDMEGLDVVSPTWLQVINEDGKVLNRSDSAYVEWAHNRGYKVWALLSNSFDADLTNKILNNTDTRDSIIKQVLTYASLYNLDGINIDFENVYLSDKDALTQFVREITPFLKEQGLVVSIDVGVPDGSETYSRCYDLVALGEVVDYVALMTYDQHWSTSPTAGSVAQLSWVETKLKRTLEMVPEDKLLLGLPFYIRLWEEKLDEDGNIQVSSEALTMERARRAISENSADVSWDDESGQFYAEYKREGSTYKIWLEDEKSIDLKSSLVHKYNLAGTAAWSRTFETEEVWYVLNKNLKNIETYREWKENNSDVEYVFKYMKEDNL